MATFPAIGLGFDTNLSPKAHKRVTVMKDHSLVIQKDSSVVLYDGSIQCIHLTAADRTTIETFYITNEDISWAFNNPHDGAAYTLFFTDAPLFVRERREATILYLCRISVVGTKDP